MDPDRRIRNKNSLNDISVPAGERQEFLISLGSIPVNEILGCSLISKGVGRIAPKYEIFLRDWQLRIYVNDILNGDYSIYP